MEKLKSRKFWFALVGAVVPLVLPVATGEVTWEQALMGTVSVVVSYVLGQGYADGHSRRALPSPRDPQAGE